MPERLNGNQLIQDLVWDEVPGYNQVDEYSQGNSRWHTHTTTIVRRQSDDKLFMIRWRKAATEYQEHEFPDEAVECEGYDETIRRYRPVKDHD